MEQLVGQPSGAHEGTCELSLGAPRTWFGVFSDNVLLSTGTL